MSSNAPETDDQTNNKDGVDKDTTSTRSSTNAPTTNNTIPRSVLLPGCPEIPFYESLHVSYISSLIGKLDSPTSFEGAVTEHLRMSGIYWTLTALSLLTNDAEVDRLLGLHRPIPQSNTSSTSSTSRPSLVDWVMHCWDPAAGGFGGNVGQDAHLLYTLSAIQILAMADRLDLVDQDRVVQFVASLQQPDGSFCGDQWGELDTRFSYCAVSILSLLGRLEEDTAESAAQYIVQCQNLDGGFGCTIGAESHAGQVFCCVGTLAICQMLHLVRKKETLLAWWLAERQCDSGGLNGRPEKQADVCYSWWILSALSILGRTEWIHRDKLASFILKCQDEFDGGIADRPHDMADVFHTFFGIAGLSLLGHLHHPSLEQHVGGQAIYRQIDPVYALPVDVVQRMGLKAQVMVPTKNSTLDPRLAKYQLVYCDDDL